MTEISILKAKIAKLENENSNLKKDLTFYKNVVDNIQIHLHINNISKPEHFGIEWGNKYYYTDTEIDVKERNTTAYYKKHYRPEDKIMMDNVSKTLREGSKPHSMVYHYITEAGNKRWHYTTCIPFKFSEDGKTTHILCATINLTDKMFNSDRYTDMVRELNKLKHELSISNLTKTELIIIKLLSSGRTEKEIAAAQYRSIHTIKTHLKNIREKLSLKKNTELVTFACEAGIG